LLPDSGIILIKGHIKGPVKRVFKGFEFKFSNQPRITKSITEAMASLDLNHVTIIIPSSTQYPLSEKVSVIGLKEFIAQY
jgi:hypothetical protein